MMAEHWNGGNGGKGSRSRPYSVSQEEFDNRWDLIFKKDKEMQVRVQEDDSKFGRCGCGRSPTGKCIGWHGLTEEAYKKALEEYNINEVSKLVADETLTNK
jgi:hypothetical protein